jgi:hypothetical protein
MRKSRKIGWMGHAERTGDIRNANKMLAGKPEGKRPLKEPKRKWEDNIKTDRKEINFERVDASYLEQCSDHLRAFVNTTMRLQKTKCGEFLDLLSILPAFQEGFCTM